MKSIGDGLRARGPIGLAVVAALAVPAAARADTVTLDGTPLNVYADGLGALQVRYDSQASGLFYDPEQNPAHAGLEIVEGAQYYPLQNGFDLETGRTGVLAATVNGSAIHSVYDVGPDIEVTEDLTYANGTPYVDAAYGLKNRSAAPISFRAGELADLFVGDNDSGNGVIAAGPPRFVGGRDPVERARRRPARADAVARVPGGRLRRGLRQLRRRRAQRHGRRRGARQRRRRRLADRQPGAGRDPDRDRALAARRARPARHRLAGHRLAGPRRPGRAPAARRGQDGQPQGQGRQGALQAPGPQALRQADRPEAGAAGDDHRHHARARDADLGGRQGGATQHAWFYRGIFKVGQTKGAKPVTDLALAGPKPSCGAKPRWRRPRRSRSRASCGATAAARFRTAGQFSSATVRGTRWVVEDRARHADHRERGVVAVRDFRRHKTVLVRGRAQQYLARAGELGLRLRRVPRRPHGGRLPVPDRLAGAQQARRARRPGVARRALFSHVTTYTLAFVPAFVWIGSRARRRLGGRSPRCSSSSRTSVIDDGRVVRALPEPRQARRRASTSASPPRSTSRSTCSRCCSWRC